MKGFLLAVLALGLAAGCTASASPATTPVDSTAAPASLVGQTRPLTGPEGKPIRLMVQEGAYAMQEKAFDENDGKTIQWIWDTYDSLQVAPGTNIRVLKWDGQHAHVEVLDGEMAGRRGWVSRLYLRA